MSGNLNKCLLRRGAHLWEIEKYNHINLLLFFVCVWDHDWVSANNIIIITFIYPRQCL